MKQRQRVGSLERNKVSKPLARLTKGRKTGREREPLSKDRKRDITTDTTEAQEDH
jgi:hypothetical protein